MQNLSLAAGFDASQYAVRVNLDGLTHEQSLVRPEPGGNCVNWIAGHILVARGSILKRLGGEPHLEGEEAGLYGRGAETFGDGEGALDIDRLRAGLEATGKEIATRLRAADPDLLDAEIDPSTLPMPLEEATVGTLLTFLLFHEGYHVGQLGLGRRLVGKPGAIG